MARAALFFNGAYVDLVDDWGAEFAEAEGINVRQSLLTLGHRVQTYAATDSAGVAGALAGMDMVVFPYMEIAAYAPSQEVEDVYSDFVSAGGTMVVHGNYRSIDLINSIFEFSLQRTYGSSSSPSTKTSVGQAEAAFNAAPSTLLANGTLHPIIGQTLPAGSKIHYSIGGGTHGGSAATVVEIPFGAGTIVYMAWDWFNAAPEGTKDGGWLAAYGGAINAALPAAAAGSNLSSADDETIAGTPGDDSIWGLGGRDVIYGRDGNDTLDGNGGHDEIMGEGGDDILRISGADDDSADGGAGHDTLVLDLRGDMSGITRYPNLGGYSAFGGHEGGYRDGSGRFIGYSEIERFVITTGAGNDALETGDGADILSTGAGDDLLDGGAGADSMAGGAGNDVYVVDHSADQAIESFGEGVDEIRTGLGVGPTLPQRIAAAYRLPDNVENLTGTGFGQGLRGNGLDNVIVAGAGTDFIDLRDGGADRVVSGDGRDVIYHGGALDPLDSNDAGAAGGDPRGDLLILQGDYSAGVTLGANALVGVEKLRVLKGTQTDFGDSAGNSYDYRIVTVDENVAAGGRLVLQGGSLQPGESVTFDGSKELDGSFQLFGGRGADDLRGGAGDDHLLGRAGSDSLTGNGGHDRLRGGLGKDALEGGAGADTFVYSAQGGADGYANAALESTGTGYDVIVGFAFAEDRIDLPGSVTGLSVDDSGAVDLSSFDADLAAALGSFAVGSAVLFTADGGELAGRKFLVVDANGDGGYQPGADFVFELLNPIGTPPAAPDFFV